LKEGGEKPKAFQPVKGADSTVANAVLTYELTILQK